MSNGGLPTNVQPQAQPRPVQPQPPQIPLEFQRSHELINNLWNDSAVGPAIRKMAKEKYGIQTQDDALEPIVGPLKKQVEELQAKIAADSEAREKKAKEDSEAAAKKTLEETINTVRDKHNLTQEGVEKMLKRMQDTSNYGDPEAAALWVLAQDPPPKAPGPSWAPKYLDQKGNLEDTKLKLLHNDPEAFRDAELQEFVSDPDKYVRDTFGAAA